ncbi:MAG: glycoside hydrolase family 15 protein [Polyangiales bacterium]
MPKQLPIEDHGVVGDLATVALVGLDGTVDFLCWPRFDSPTVFASLLDAERGGFWRIAPEENEGAPLRQKQMYLPDTNVLYTRFMGPEGMSKQVDLMPVGEGPQQLIRTVHGIRGRVQHHMVCAPRLDYGRARQRVEARGPHEVIWHPEQGEPLRLRASVPLTLVEGDVHARFEVGCEQSVTFVLDQPDGESVADLTQHAERVHDATVAYWRQWLARSTYRGRWREMVNRSALMLKLLSSRAHGAIIAAPTFGLPEEPGGSRNWDYRYTWIRDAGFSLYALMRLGFTEEADAFMGWIAQRAEEGKGDGCLEVMYRVDGHTCLDEVELHHLAGYGGARPVRIGNAAHEQTQLDIYGALLDAVYLANKYGQPIGYDAWRGVVRSVDFVCKNWMRPDEGIWEFRGERRELLHSRLMCWVAVDRAVRLADRRSLPAPIVKWAETRTAIHHSIFETFWSDERGAFVQAKGSSALDASCLLMPLVRFVSPADPKWQSTLDAVGRELVKDALVLRYDGERSADVDGLEGREGSFTPCSFWYVEALARGKQVDKARYLFEAMLGYANHLGLYAEELGDSGEHLGNFPQALTHLALISAAFSLDRELSDTRRGAWER